jgi:uncharacterized protein (DUF362 family)
MDKITRRDFIKMGAGAAITTLLPKSLFAADNKNGPIIGVAHGDKAKLVAAAVGLVGGIYKFVKPGDVVCLKPNLSFASNTDCGATTSPDIVRAMAQLCLDAGASRIFVVDHTIQDATLCVERSRIEEAIIDKKVSLVTLQQERQYAEIEVPAGKQLKTIQVAKVMQDADVLINMPTAKSHSATGVSLSIKNLMGLIWDRGHLHRMNLHDAIAELATVIKPDLTIVDATRALTSGGPGGPGKTVALNTVIAGIDPVAVDSYTVSIVQWYRKSWTGSQVRYIRSASDLGLGEIDTGKMQIKEAEV